ncbi:MAG TPA: pantetheine-phosphate adenylyltransferase [Planctomycetota bacterium]|jgi:pantetheine-phosphate adenylyltransferase|nr:pantetheine-phosphate adenylyltransferase [Planctomycetota bacterium]MDP7245882.1 pantetheine-phosphate adenylyltransferase [Planctomycetota bacterium]HJM39104.1 pantetheine-phosphate adenylyltransferase [Planctomycetota bacterium]|tara:strand:- start:19966 stop:20457 length:492 start_codon:yes stop_codon:yes gene_type:complete
MPSSVPAALYPGTFDPVTRGHLDLIHRGLGLFGSLRVGVARNASKSPLFTAEERVDMIRAEVENLPEVTVESFGGLVVDYCKENGISTILRGVRTISDFEYEYQMALTNRTLDDGIETVFVMPSEEFSFVSSRLIKEVYAGGGDLERFLTSAVRAQMVDRLKP